MLAQLRQQRDDYAVFVAEDYDGYLGRMARDGTWGDHLTLQAGTAPAARAEACNRKVNLPAP